MAGAVLNRQLNATQTGRIQFDVATESDEAEICRLLRENPMPGRISISLEREPNYFSDADLPGEEKQTIVARESGRVICVGSCSIRERFVNGNLHRVGYLGGLRLDASVAGRFDILRGGYQFFRELQASAPADFYFTSIAAENLRARDFLERGLPGMPSYKLIGDFVTLLVPTFRSSRREEAHFKNSEPGTGNADFSQSLLTSAATDELIDRLREHGHQYQLAPSWSKREMSSLKPLGLSTEDFYVVENGGRILASAALWDQRMFKQTVIHGYTPWLACLRPVVNFAAMIANQPCLPAVGSTLAHAFVSHLAVEATQADALVSMISALQKIAAKKGIEFLTLGFASDDPRLITVRSRFRCREYRSRIYLVNWPETGTMHDLDDRCLGPDVALL